MKLIARADEEEIHEADNDGLDPNPQSRISKFHDADESLSSDPKLHRLSNLGQA